MIRTHDLKRAAVNRRVIDERLRRANSDERTNR
jgi:hypothetical protein